MAWLQLYMVLLFLAATVLCWILPFFMARTHTTVDLPGDTDGSPAVMSGGSSGHEDGSPWVSLIIPTALVVATAFIAFVIHAGTFWPVLTEVGFILVLCLTTLLLMRGSGAPTMTPPLRRKLVCVINTAGGWALLGMSVVALQVWGLLPSAGVAGLVGLIPVCIAVAYGIANTAGELRTAAHSPFDREERRFWKAGVFYTNPADPAVFVPKRLGVGWTLNFGNPRAWIFLASMLIAAAILPFAVVAVIVQVVSG
jgi:hypothetical protein